MRSRNALVCSYHVVQPDRDSGARRIFHLIEFLIQDGWSVTFLASDGAGDPLDVQRLERSGVAVYDATKQSVEELFSEQQFDLAVIAFWLNAARYLSLLRKLSPKVRIIVDSVDLHFLRESRRVFSSTGPREDSIGILGEKFALNLTGEINTYAGADAVLTVSHKEADLINDFLCNPNLASAVPDSEDLKPSSIAFEERRGIVSVGSFQHPPNVQAVRWLCSEILPRVDPALLKEHPVYIVGNAMDGTISALGRNLPNIRFVGWVPDVIPYFERSRVSVVPLLFGAGTKRKLMQALAIGTPSVSTNIGIEGFGLTDGKDVLVANDSDAFAKSITRLLTDAELWNQISQAGQTGVREFHSMDTARQRFLEVIYRVLDKRPNFTALPYEAVTESAREFILQTVPVGASVLIASKGDPELLRVENRRMMHFPQDASGNYPGYHPRDDADAITQLTSLRAAGAQYLAFPRTSFWWFDHYKDFKLHLETVYQLADQTQTCCIYKLQPSPAEDVTSPDSEISPVLSSQDILPGFFSGNNPTGTRLIAFYLPQFHPIPENDLWWGEGFTEWRNVGKAVPQFPGHYQPHVPADLGFYDLRLAETREHQASLAQAYGIHGFCYYHYWFSGKRLLERPFTEVLASGAPDFPFCLCWANDPWSRRWDGRDADLLQAQTYSPEDDVAHIRALIPALADKRAITIDGKPIFLIYRARHLPAPQKTIEVWRKQVKKAGLPGIYLIAVETAWDLGWDATSVGFDAKVLFQPQFGWLMTHATQHGARIPIPGKDSLQVYDYAKVIEQLKTLESVPYRRFESVFPGWDNTARVGDRAVVMNDTSPALYQQWLSDTISKTAAFPRDERLVFINAWNEWAEGCHLEPDVLNGHTYLEATARSLESIAFNSPVSGHALS